MPDWVKQTMSKLEKGSKEFETSGEYVYLRVPEWYSPLSSF